MSNTAAETSAEDREHAGELDLDKTLFIYVDESGDINFTPKSSYNFYLGGLCSGCNPAVLSHFYNTRHKYAPLHEGDKSKSKPRRFDSLHATEDFQVTRNEIFGFLKDLPEEEMDFYVVSLKKNRINPTRAGDAIWLYSQASRMLINSIVYKVDMSKYEAICIYIGGTALDARKEKAVIKGIRMEIAEYFRKKGISMPYRIFNHQSNTHVYLQVCDYLLWAYNVKHEKKRDARSYDLVKKFFANEFHPFKAPHSTTEYYAYE